MMIRILSCLHEVNSWDDAVDIIQKEYFSIPFNNNVYKTLSYKTVCVKCAEELKKEDLLFENEELATQWLWEEDDE